jgi:formate hydrogenlyase transcriptional activator
MRAGSDGESDQVERLAGVAVRALEHRRARERQGPERRFEQIVGKSPALEAVLDQVVKVAPSDSSVLVLGETGTGKEVIARAIHNLSGRCGRPFVRLNCAAIPLDLLESELFGHERGAFTGAIARRIGRFEMADTGTLFLDEIGDLPMSLQPKLLRVLQEQEFERLGSSTSQRVNVRLVTATHRDLPELVRQNRFRLDLFYRLHVLPIHLPALRERREDIVPLVMHFVEVYSQRMGKSIRRVSPQTMKAFKSYTWPGNIRELQNLVERAVIMSSDGGELANPLEDDADKFDSSEDFTTKLGGVRHRPKQALSIEAPQGPSLKQQSPEVVPLRFRA